MLFNVCICTFMYYLYIYTYVSKNSLFIYSHPCTVCIGHSKFHIYTYVYTKRNTSKRRFRIKQTYFHKILHKIQLFICGCYRYAHKYINTVLKIILQLQAKVFGIEINSRLWHKFKVVNE